jgi:co-chaperonin GroES (HSP10)
LNSDINPIELKSFTPLYDGVVVADMKFNERYTSGGIFIPSDDKQLHGVHARWGRVYSVGPEQTEIKVGQWVCIAHGRWTRGVTIKDDTGIHTIRRIDNADILMVSDEEVIDEILGVPLTQAQMAGAPRY